MNLNGLVTVALSAALSALTGCSNHQDTKADASVSSVKPRTTAAAAACASGERVDPAGHCVPDADAATAATNAPSASAAAPPGKCPDLGNTERVFAFDWAKDFGVTEALAGKLKGASGAAAETRALAHEIDAELRMACLGLANALGAKGPFTGADATCQAATDAVRTTRAKLGPTAKVSVNVHAPVCATPIPSDCATGCAGSAARASCDASATVGACADNCEGTCEFIAAGHCDGNCQGRCDANFTGSCTGTCKGKCNGTEMKAAGTCAGKCEGTCEGMARGACKGTCRGGCQGTVSGCTGICSGKCSSSLHDPRCTGMPKIESATAECTAYCQTRAVRQASCTPAIANVTVTEAKDAAAGTLYEQAIERSLPLLLKVERQLRGRVEMVAKNQEIVTQALNAVTTSGAPTLATLNPCLFGVQKAVTEGATQLSTDFRAASLVAATAQAH